MNDWLKNGLPVYHGGKNRSAARADIDKLGGPEGFKTAYRNNLDGSVTITQLKGDMAPRIRTEGGGVETPCKIGMDSGVVNLVSASFLETFPGNYDDGKLLFTARVSTYIGSGGKVINEIRPPAAVGIAPVDGATAKSFAKSVQVTRDDLYVKKRVAVLCPPSVFTGKTRLYVQSIYGRQYSPLAATLGPSSALDTPSVVINGIEITTSCGVHLDVLTGKHYLISVGAGSATIYPMGVSECAKKLRPKLLDPALSVAEKEKVEAYILSQSKPVETGKQILATTPAIVSSMGYGWHFNWSGLVCDIVTVNYVSAPADGYENESTHYRLTFSSSGGVFSVAPSTVEGPTRWANHKHGEVILNPVWPLFLLEKTGAHVGGYGDAPYYVFYKRDEIQVCRYTAVLTEVDAGARREPPYYNPGLFKSVGTDAVDYRTFVDWTGTNITMSCGDESLTYRVSAHIETCYSHSAPVCVGTLSSTGWGHGISAESGVKYFDSGRPATIPTSPVGDPWEGVIEVSTGAQPTDYPQVSFDFTGTGKCTHTNIDFPATWTSETFDSYVEEHAYFIAVIPFYDAEALYLLGTHSTTQTETGLSEDRTGGSFFAAKAVGGTGPSDVPESLISQYEALGTDYGGVVSGSALARTIGPVITSNARLICNAGVITSDVSFPQVGQCFDAGFDLVDATYPTHCSAYGAAVYGKDTGISVGLAPAEIAGIPFTFVGWA